MFESAVIERYRRREESVEETLIDMYPAGVSTRQVDDVCQLLWGDRMPSQTLGDKLKRVYEDIDAWRERPLVQDYPYVFMDGVWRKRCWGGSVENVSILVAIGETTTYLLDDYPWAHRRRIRTNNMIERLNREIRRRTRVVGSFPDGRSALMLICARVRYVTSSEWSTRRYLDMSRLGETVHEAN